MESYPSENRTMSLTTMSWIHELNNYEKAMEKKKVSVARLGMSTKIRTCTVRNMRLPYPDLRNWSHGAPEASFGSVPRLRCSGETVLLTEKHNITIYVCVCVLTDTRVSMRTAWLTALDLPELQTLVQAQNKKCRAAKLEMMRQKIRSECNELQSQRTRLVLLRD